MLENLNCLEVPNFSVFPEIISDRPNLRNEEAMGKMTRYGCILLEKKVREHK